MASTEVEELIRRAEMLTRDEQLYLIERLREKTEIDRTEKAVQPLVGEELVKVMERIAALPLESEPDPDLSTTYRDVLYPKNGDAP